MTIYKRHTAPLLVSILMILGLGSCVDDNFNTDIGGSGDDTLVDTDAYITIRIKGNNTYGSRAGEQPGWGKFEDGIEEQAISKNGNFAFFFKTDGTYVSNWRLESFRRLEED